jgi:hypothetical protein
MCDNVGVLKIIKMNPKILYQSRQQRIRGIRLHWLESLNIIKRNPKTTYHY